MGRTIESDVWIVDNQHVEDFQTLEVIRGSLKIDRQRGPAVVHLPALRWVQHFIKLFDSTVAELRLPALTRCRGFSAETNPRLTTVELPALTQVLQHVTVLRNPRLTRVDLAGLRRTGFDLAVEHNDRLASIELSSLERAQRVRLLSNPCLAELRLPVGRVEARLDLHGHALPPDVEATLRDRCHR